MDSSLENVDDFFPPNSPDLNIIPISSKNPSLETNYFFSPCVVEKFIKAPVYHSFASERVDSVFSNRDQVYADLQDENEMTDFKGTFYDKLPQEVFDSSHDPSTSCTSQMTARPPQITSLPAPSNHMQADSSVKESVSELMGKHENEDSVDCSVSNDGTNVNEVHSESKEDVKKNDGHVLNLNSEFLNSSSNTVNSENEYTSNKGTRKKRKYKPRRHIPKTLNQRGRPRKVHVNVTKASFDPVWEFARSLPRYLLALNNFDPTEIPEYQELRRAKILNQLFLPE